MNKKFNIADLLKDASFLKWIRKEEGADQERWEQWEQEQPNAKKLKEEAQLIERGIVFNKSDKLSSRRKAGWDNIVAKIDANTVVKQVPRKRIWPKIAAAVGLVLISVAGIYSYLNQKTLVEHQTNYAEMETILLPDGTEIILGANSHLSFYDNMAQEVERKVSLEGLAFFKVASQGMQNKFTVELKDMEIEVVGTAFNVNSYRLTSIVSLTEGKVTLRKVAKEQKLEVGETAYFNTKKQQFEIIRGQTDYWSSWIAEKWSFGTGTPMKEVIQRIEETYGFDCKIIDASILDKIASGDISVESQEVLLESLSYLLNINILIKDKTLTFSMKEEN